MSVPAVVLLDVNETLADLSSLRRRIEEVGAPGELFTVWFAGTLRDGFALTAAGSYAEFGTVALATLRGLRPDYELWRDFPYEYEYGRLAIDLINGSDLLRRWVDDPRAGAAELDRLVLPDETSWQEERAPLLLYR